ncbi:hypothetical protein TNCV_4406251 [Trichonephila clavipes]|nr:hypothetical protein TNCV_4406251 [Trichonephila clavipes]
MWSMIAQRLTQITPPAATPDQLWQRKEATWSAVPQEHIQNLFELMPRLDGDNVQELMDSHKQELKIDELINCQLLTPEKDIDELESLDPFQLEDRMTVEIRQKASV